MGRREGAMLEVPSEMCPGPTVWMSPKAGNSVKKVTAAITFSKMWPLTASAAFGGPPELPAPVFAAREAFPTPLVFAPEARLPAFMADAVRLRRSWAPNLMARRPLQETCT